MRYERSEGRERHVNNEPAVRGPVAQEEEEVNQERTADPDEDDAGATRRGSSSERASRDR